MVNNFSDYLLGMHFSLQNCWAILLLTALLSRRLLWSAWLLFFCKICWFLHGSVFYLNLDVSGWGCHFFFIWLSRKPFNTYVWLRKIFDYVFEVLVSVLVSFWRISIVLGNFYNSTHSLSAIVIFISFCFINVSSLFILGKHFILILYFADWLFLNGNSLLISKSV